MQERKIKMSHLNLSDQEIENQYGLITQFHSKFLARYGVKLPQLRDNKGNFTKNALVLTYLAIGYPKTREITKEELTRFIRKYYPDTNDVQQARHLGAQDGWWIAAGGRDNIVVSLKRGSYQLHTLEEPYPGFKKGHRQQDTSDFDLIKAAYGYRCATCGSKEGQPHFHWPGAKTLLQKSHQDPNKPLRTGNIIPQCQKCNRADRDRWVYDDKGRVIKLAKASFVKNFDKDVRKKIYHILKKEFKNDD